MPSSLSNRLAICPGRAELMVEIVDPVSNLVEVKLPVEVKLRALFSKFSIQPSREINFGPVVADTVAGGKNIQVVNLGEFPFVVQILDPSANKVGAPASIRKQVPTL